MKIEEIALWESFQAVAKHKSFSQASRELKMGAPQLSKKIAKLEDVLGIRLFKRSTRVVNLTDEGKALLPKVDILLDDLAALESSFESEEKLSGTVRITCVPYIAHRLLIPVLEDFTAAHPKVQIEIELSENIINLIDSNFDMAIRIQDAPADSSLVYRKLASNQLVLCASPKYLKSRPKIKKVSDLKSHEMLMLEIHRNCKFRDTNQQLKDLVKFKKITCKNGWFLTQLGINAMGVLVRAHWDVRDSLKSGELTEILPNHPLESFGNVYAVIPSRRYLAPRVRAFLDFVVNKSADWAKEDKR